MDGLGSPDSLMEHSMLDIKNSSPYACYSPKLSYDVFPTNRGKQWNIYKTEKYNNYLQDLISVELKTRLSGISTKTTPATVDLQVTTVCPILTSPPTLWCNPSNPPRSYSSSITSGSWKHQRYKMWSLCADCRPDDLVLIAVQ